jgi:predicted CXXCH cytochrome family protein
MSALLAAAVGFGPRDARARSGNPLDIAAHEGIAIGASWTDSRCGSCHTIDPVFSHPTGFAPDRPLPAAFPLENGRMTCLTCHDGAGAPSHAAARRSGEPLLRSSLEGRAFCAECHTEAGFSAQSPHAAAVSRAHLLWPDASREAAAGNGMPGLDRESTTCLECHDGMVASGIGGHAGGRAFADDFPREHPIGVVYRSVGDGRGMNRMVNPHALDRRVRLFDGNIGCGSCHSVYSPLRDDLVMSNRGSALCLSCHDG